MKKIVFLIIGLFQTIVVFSQTNYYTESKTFSEGDYTYQAEISLSGFVKLYNTANRWMTQKSVYKETGKVFVMPEVVDIELFSHESWLESRKQIENIVNSAFTFEEKQRLQGNWFIIVMHINSTTGNIDDAYFEFHKRDPYVTIPVSVYRNIELKIKEKIKFTLTDEGRKLNYIFLWYDPEPSLSLQD